MKTLLLALVVLGVSGVMVGCSGGSKDEPSNVGEITTSPKGAADAAANGGKPKPRGGSVDINKS